MAQCGQHHDSCRHTDCTPCHMFSTMYQCKHVLSFQSLISFEYTCNNLTVCLHHLCHIVLYTSSSQSNGNAISLTLIILLPMWHAKTKQARPISAKCQSNSNIVCDTVAMICRLFPDSLTFLLATLSVVTMLTLHNDDIYVDNCRYKTIIYLSLCHMLTDLMNTSIPNIVHWFWFIPHNASAFRSSSIIHAQVSIQSESAQLCVLIHAALNKDDATSNPLQCQSIMRLLNHCLFWAIARSCCAS